MVPESHGRFWEERDTPCRCGYSEECGLGDPPPGLEWEDRLYHCVIPRGGEGSCGPRDLHGLGVWEGGLGSSAGAHNQPPTMLPSSPLTLEAEASCKG